jgi:hypothetical protein
MPRIGHSLVLHNSQPWPCLYRTVAVLEKRLGIGEITCYQTVQT